MLWLVMCILFSVMDEATFYDEADDDFDEAYYDDGFFTSPMAVFRDYARKRRSDVTTSLRHSGTNTRNSEYEDTDMDLIMPEPDLPLAMLTVHADINNSSKPNSDDPGTRFSTPTTVIASQNYSKQSGTPNAIHLHPLRSANLDSDINHDADHPTRSPNPNSALTAYTTYTEYEESSKSNNDTTYEGLSTRSADFSILYVPTISSAPNDYLNIYPDLPMRFAYTIEISTSLPSVSNPSSTTTDTTTDTVSTISTSPTTTVVTSTNSSSRRLLYLSHAGYPLTPYEGHRERNMVEVPRTASEPPVHVDVPMLLKLIDNLTIDYDWNLTRRFNESLQRYNIPTCQSWTTPTSETPTGYPFEKAAVVAKCFVCGMKTKGIPYDSHCADAFSGDFIPLVPVDAQARMYITRFRKFCRYLDIKGVVENPLEPHSVFGRFTGGCSVRWVDLTGVYTQRMCRNRRRAVLGNHFASKRMAKLEMALRDVENGCIISPVATLLPMSRGISLYARFHACVCTGSWCNSAVQIPTWTSSITIMSLLLILKALS